MIPTVQSPEAVTEVTSRVDVGAIAGGVVGGVGVTLIILFILVVTLKLTLMRRKSVNR